MGVQYHLGCSVQRGQGLGSIIKALGKRLIPIARVGVNAGKRVLQSDFAKHIAKKSLSVGADILKDATKNIILDTINGDKDITQTAQIELENAKKKISDAIKGGDTTTTTTTTRKRKRKSSSPKVAVVTTAAKRKRQYNLLDDDDEY
jgi:hypothetical protein